MQPMHGRVYLFNAFRSGHIGLCQDKTARLNQKSRQSFHFCCRSRAPCR